MTTCRKLLGNPEVLRTKKMHADLASVAVDGLLYFFGAEDFRISQKNARRWPFGRRLPNRRTKFCDGDDFGRGRDDFGRGRDDFGRGWRRSWGDRDCQPPTPQPQVGMSGVGPIAKAQLQPQHWLLPWESE